MNQIYSIIHFIKEKNTFLTCRNWVGCFINADFIISCFSLPSDNISSIVNMFSPIMFRIWFSSSSSCFITSLSLSLRNWCSFTNWAEIWSDSALDFSWRKKTAFRLTQCVTPDLTPWMYMSGWYVTHHCVQNLFSLPVNQTNHCLFYVEQSFQSLWCLFLKNLSYNT